MKLETIIKMASRAYDKHEPDLIIRASKGKDVGDTLAKFIAIELRETYDKKASSETQRAEAYRTMCSALSQLGDVVSVFEPRF